VTGIANESYAVLSAPHTRSTGKPTVVTADSEVGCVSTVLVGSPAPPEMRIVSNGVEEVGVAPDEAHPRRPTQEITLSRRMPHLYEKRKGDDTARNTACPAYTHGTNLTWANPRHQFNFSQNAETPSTRPGRGSAMSRSGRVASIGLWAVAAVLAASVAASQTPQRVIHGMVFDSRDQPIALVNVSVAKGASAISDDSGRFRLEISHRDRVEFDFRRLGYMPSRFALAAGGDTTISVLLLPTAQQLSSVDVKEAAPKPISLAGFEERMLARKRAAGAGYFLTAKDIEGISPTRTTQVVENIPGMSVRRTNLDRYAIYGRAGNGGDCLATIWLDGVHVAGASQPVVDRRTRRVVASAEVTELDPYVNPSELAGVEIYPRGIMAPHQFLPPGDPNAARCAVVAFWTKHGR